MAHPIQIFIWLRENISPSYNKNFRARISYHDFLQRGLLSRKEATKPTVLSGEVEIPPSYVLRTV